MIGRIGCCVALILLMQPVIADELTDMQTEFKQMQADLVRMQQRLLQNQQRMADMQRTIKTLQAAQGTQSDEQVEEISFINDTLDQMSQEGKVEFNLYATLEFEDFDNQDSEFDARNVELLAGAHLTDRLSVFTEIEFERTANTSGGNRQGEVEVEQGWLEYVINEAFKPRFGVVLVPFGRFNLEHFDVQRDLTDRPIAMRRIIPVTWAEAGLGFTGTTSSLDYQLYLINGLTNDISDRGFRGARGAFGDDNNQNKAVVGRIAYSPIDNLELGFSGYHGQYDDSHHIEGLDIDWLYRLGPVEVIGELVGFDLEEGGFQNNGNAVPNELLGGYTQLNYHFQPDFFRRSFLGQGFDNPQFTVSLRYGWADNDDDGDLGIGNNREDRWTLGFNYRPTETFVFKIEYQWNNSRNEALERGNNDGFISSVSGAF